MDAFGHSSANARFFAEIGMDALVFARMPYTMLMDWADNGKKDFIWKPEFATSSEESPALFTHVLYDHYSAPDGFHFFNGGAAMKNTQSRVNYDDINRYVKIVKDYGRG